MRARTPAERQALTPRPTVAPVRRPRRRLSRRRVDPATRLLPAVRSGSLTAFRAAARRTQRAPWATLSRRRFDVFSVRGFASVPITRERPGDEGGGGGDDGINGDFSSTITVPADPASPYRETFPVGLTSDPSGFYPAPAYNSGGGTIVWGGSALDAGNCRWLTGGAALYIGQTSGPNYHHDITIENVDFRGINYGLLIDGKNIRFVNCAFDLENFNFVDGELIVYDVVPVNAGLHVPYASLVNCWFDGGDRFFPFNKFFRCKWHEIKNCKLWRVPADCIFEGPTHYRDDNVFINNLIWVNGSNVDARVKIDGVLAVTAATSVTITSGFAVETYGTSGSVGIGSVSIAAGTYTLQQIADALNAQNTTYGLGAGVVGGIFRVCARPYRNANSSPNKRSLRLTGSQTDWEKVFGSIGASPAVTAYNESSNNDPYTGKTFVFAHADLWQFTNSAEIGSIQTGRAKAVVRNNHLDVTPFQPTPLDSTESLSAPVTAPFNLTSSQNDHNLEIDIYANDVVIDRLWGLLNMSGYTDNTTTRTNYVGSTTLPDCTNIYGWRKIHDNYMQPGVYVSNGGGYSYPEYGSYNRFTAVSGWSNPSTLAVSVRSGKTICFFDGWNIVTITSSGTVTGAEIIAAINAHPSFRFRASNANVGGGWRLALDGNYYNDRPAGRKLTVGGTADIAGEMTGFGLPSLAPASKTGWATPGTLQITGLGNATQWIKFWDGDHDPVVVTPTAGVITGQNILDAIATANGAGDFNFSASIVADTLTWSGAGALIIDTDVSTVQLAAFGLADGRQTTNTTGGGVPGVIFNPTSWFNNLNYDDRATLCPVAWKGVNGVTSINPPMDAPTGLAVTEATETTLTLTIDAIAGAGRVQASIDGGATWTVDQAASGEATETIAFTGLSPGTAYSIAVRGANLFDDSGDPQQFGDEATLTTSTVTTASRLMASATDALMAAPGVNLVWTKTEAETLGLLLALD